MIDIVDKGANQGRGVYKLTWKTADTHQHTQTLRHIQSHPTFPRKELWKQTSLGLWCMCMCTCVCWGACRLYCYAHYTSCFQQFHLINNKCTIITASPPALPVFCQLPPGQPPWTLWPPPSSRADSYEAEGTWADGGGQTPNVRGNTHLSVWINVFGLYAKGYLP